MNIFSILALKKANTSLSSVSLPGQLQTLGVIPTKVAVTDATFTIPNDVTKFYCFDSASAQTITVPTGLTGFPIGTAITIVRLGDGSVTVVAGSGVTIRKSTGTLVISAKNKTVQLIKVAENDWLAAGSFN